MTNSTGSAGEFYTRLAAAATGTPYRMSRTEQGWELTVDVNAPQSQEPLSRRRVSQVHTYRIGVRPKEKAFSITDVVRTVEYEAGLSGVRLGRTVSVGRSVYTTWQRNLDGSGQYTFSSADGHRLIRGVAGELGWREVRPTSVKVALGFGIFGALTALITLTALAAVFWF